MAEGWARNLKDDVIEAYSAGIKKHGLNRVAVNVMREAGVDISQHRSKKLNSLQNIAFDYVITVCDSASESCPVFSGECAIIHQGFDDPPALASDAPSEEAAMNHYRRVRDEIRAFIEMFPECLEKLSG